MKHSLKQIIIFKKIVNKHIYSIIYINIIISGILRGYDPAIRMFIDQDGLELLVKALQSNNVASKSRAAFLIDNLFQNNEEVKGIIRNMM